MTKVSVLMSVYNGERYLAETISSVLNQTEQDFELVIADDGSTDGTEEVVRFFTDPRVRYFKLAHVGRVAALNRGISECAGEYIAVLDADDLFTSEKLEKQLRYMEERGLALCGTWAAEIDEHGNKIGEMAYPPVDTASIRRYSLLHNPFIHSSVMVKRDVLIAAGFYRAARFVEDYELWTRIMYTSPCGNVPELLTQYRRHVSQMTRKIPLTIRTAALRVRLLALWRFIFRH